MADSEALHQLLQYIDINQADDGSLGDPFVIFISYQQQADKLRFIEELTQSSLTTDLKFKTYFPNTDEDHGIGKIIGHLVDDANHNRLSLITSLATEPQGELDHQFLSYINLNRDRLTYQNLHYVLFVKADQMEDFVAGAPDLWSFRQQVLYLERDETQTIPSLELSSQLMWQNIEADIEHSTFSAEAKQQATDKVVQTKALIAKIRSRNDKAQLLIDLTEWLMRRELYIQSFEVAEQILINHSDVKPELLARIYYVCGTTQYRMAHYREALKYSQDGLDLTKVYSFDNIAAELTLLIGDIFIRINDDNAALKSYDSAFEQGQKLDNKLVQTRALSRKAEIKRKANKLDESINIYAQSLAIAQQSKNLDDEATTRTNLGYVLYQKGKTDEALQHFEEALTHFEQTNYIHGIANCHINISLLLLTLGKLNNGKYHIIQGLHEGKKINDKNTIASAYFLLAQCHQNDDKQLAIDYAQKSLNIHTRLNNPECKLVKQFLTELE